MARGRKRKPGKRHPCGKRVRAETEREAMSVALDARRRHYAVSASRARDERLGTALGRLAFRGLISDLQYQAGAAFAALHRRHNLIVGLPMPSPRSVAGLLVNEGIFGATLSEPVPETVEAVKRRYGEATAALDACDREERLSPGRRPTFLVYRVICADEEMLRWDADDIGSLRVALNALVRVFRLR
jgi:hypothetical protein